MELRSGGGATEDLSERLAALTARLDQQQHTIARLEGAFAGRPSTMPAKQTATGTLVKRRGMLTNLLGATAAAALLGVAKEARPAHADMRATLINDSSNDYGLLAADGGDPIALLPPLGGFKFGVIGTRGTSGFGVNRNAGVFGSGADSAGVIGFSNSNFGVWGKSNTEVGVHGVSNGGYGVYGYSYTSAGVGGVSNTFIGVYGRSANDVGVHGVSDTNYGVYGFSKSGVGMVGTSTDNIGVYGASSNNVGVFGDAANNTAVMGRTGAGIGVYGTATNPGGGGRAAVFDGTVLVNGPFTVVGGPKSAGVKHPDGSVRRMYCQESPEPWFEDFGAATLQNGRAEITLDPEFDAVVKGDDYLVFMTAEGDCNGLFISRKGPHKFVVEELKGGKSTLQFSYRIVSRRRENVGKRLEKIDVKGPPTPKISPQEIRPEPRRPQPGS
jgi:hypothetical protein